MSPNQGLRRVLRGFSSSSQKGRNSSKADAEGLIEPQSIAQVLSQTPEEGTPLSPSTSSPAQTLNKVDANTRRIHARELSSASAPLPDTTKSPPVILRYASEPQQTANHLDQTQITHQHLARDKQILEQKINYIQLVLEQVKSDLLQATKEKHALKQQVHRQDEENQKVKDQLRDAKQQYESLRSELETHTKVKADLLSANKETKRLKDDLRDAKRKLEPTTSELKDTTTRLQALDTKHKELDKSFRDSRLENGRLEIDLAEAQSKITSLTEEKNQAEQHMKKYRDFSQAIYKEMQPEQDKNRSLEAEVTQLKSLLEQTTSAFDDTLNQLTSLQTEKKTWQGSMDTMVHKVFASERRIRMLHHAARTLEPQKLDDNSDRGIRRGKNAKSNTRFSAEIVETVSTLNKAILDAAMNFAPLFFSPDSKTWSGNIKRAQVIFGEWVTSRMQTKGWNRPWMLQSVIQMFLVDWCRAIIEAWYPKQQSFAELFVAGLASQKSSFKGTIEFQAFKTSSSDLDSSLDITTWATQILDDLLQVVPAPSMDAKYREDILLPILINLAQLSYDLRLALAEGDICGNVQLYVPPPDIQFQPDNMNATMDTTNSEIQKHTPKEPGDIVGCTSIGLRNISIQKSNTGASLIHRTTVLTPNVIFARDMDQKNSIQGVHIPVKEDVQWEMDTTMD